MAEPLDFVLFEVPLTEGVTSTAPTVSEAFTMGSQQHYSSVHFSSFGGVPTT